MDFVEGSKDIADMGFMIYVIYSVLVFHFCNHFWISTKQVSVMYALIVNQCSWIIYNNCMQNSHDFLNSLYKIPIVGKGKIIKTLTVFILRLCNF